MRRWHALILLATLLLIISSAYALPWKIPARWRVIYEINTDPITENNMVVIELNIPESIYDWIYSYADKGAFCEMAKGNADIRWLYPVIYYVSTYNPEQRVPYSQYVVDTYQHEVNGCVDDFGNQQYLRLPKTVRITLEQLDGNTNFSNYDHYIYVYQPQGFMKTFEWSDVGTPDVGWATSHKASKNVPPLKVNMPLGNIKYMFIKLSAGNTGGSWCFQLGVDATLTMKDGESKTQRILYIDYCGYQITTGWKDVFNVLATTVPLSDYDLLNKIEYGGNLGYCRGIDDIYILMG